MTKDILDTLRVISPNIPFGHESGKHLQLLEYAKKTAELLPMNPALKARREAVEASLPYAEDKWKCLFGESHRTDSILSFYIEEALTRHMSLDAHEHLPYLIELGEQLADETMTSKEARKVHPAIGNPLFTHNVLMPIGWLAWSKDKKVAIKIWRACLETKSFTFIPAMLWGMIAYTYRAKRPPLFALLSPFLGVLGVVLLLKRASKGRFKPWKIGRRPRFLNKRVLREVKKTGKTYGYGNYIYAIEDHFDVYNREKEHWADSAHWYWQELKATVPGPKPIWDCYVSHIKTASPAVAGAIGSHMGCLSTLFRTSAGSVIESYLFALAMKPSETQDTPGVNFFHAFFKKYERQINTRAVAWRNNTTLINSMLKGGFDLQEPIFFEGDMYVPWDIKEEDMRALKRAYERFISFRGPLQHLRYLWLLWGFNDPDQVKWLPKCIALSPKRMKLEMKHSPRAGQGMWIA